MTSLTIVFAGTPAFALPCLEALFASNHHLKAVYTQPDRPAGRGRQIQASGVKEWATTHALPIHQPVHFKHEATVHELAALKPDLMVVIAYGLILPRAVLAIPRLGCINVHGSLLPRWRGASPIQQAILHGDKETGITIMQMDAGMDTGPMLGQVSCPIGNDTAGALHDRLAALAVTPLLSTIDDLALSRAQATTQHEDDATYAPKINKSDALIQWHHSAIEIDRQIRAFNPWPIAHTNVGDAILRIHNAYPIQNTPKAIPGTILALDKHGMQVATGEGTLQITTLQFPGAKAMSVGDWLHAKRQQLHVGLVLT